MSLKSSVAHILNGFSELFNIPAYSGYVLNTGIDHGLSRVHYNDRAVEVPFLFRKIRDPPAKVLDIGCSENTTAVQLAMLGYGVTGIDIRDYSYTHDGLRFIKADFLKHEFGEKFDIAVNISAIEHFGLIAYGSSELDSEADVKAVEKVRGLLKQNGQFIFTAPYGVPEVQKAMRVYGKDDIKRLFRGFRISEIGFYGVYGNRKIRMIRQSEAEKIRWQWGIANAGVLVNAFKK